MADFEFGLIYCFVLFIHRLLNIFNEDFKLLECE